MNRAASWTWDTVYLWPIFLASLAFWTLRESNARFLRGITKTRWFWNKDQDWCHHFVLDSL
jgi:hypothetical protein